MVSVSASVHLDKSTNVRPAGRSKHRRLRAFAAGLGVFSPALAGRFAEWFFLRPPRLKASPREIEWRLRAKRTVIIVGGRRIVTRTWGEGPTVVLVHGWAGRAGQMGAMGMALAQAGFRAVAFDAPGHGQSDGSVITMPDFVQVISRLAEDAGGLFGLIGHSMGGVAVSVALSEGLAVQRAVMLGAPSDLKLVVAQFSQAINLSRASQRAFARRMEARFGADVWRRFSPVHLAPEQNVPALLIHNLEDDEVPHEQAREVAAAWPSAQLYSTSELGHTRMLREPVVVERIVSFMVAARANPCSAEGRPA